MQYTKDNPLRIFEGFAGYGSQSLALERLKRSHPEFDYRIVGFSEIDPYAIKAYHAIHGEEHRNYGDISKIDWAEVPDFDFFTMSSPCQDFSNAGLQRGGEEGSGTRSSLLWECRRAIVAKHPKYVMMENVSALVSDKFRPLLFKWLEELASYGYTNYLAPSFEKPWESNPKGGRLRTSKYILNSKDYGVPQNRERVFVISIHGEHEPFVFPKPFPLEKRLKDVLEENVDEKYYLDDEKVAKFVEHCDKKQAEGCGFKFEPDAPPTER